MSSHGPADKMHPAGILLSRLVGSAVIGMLVLVVGLVLSNTSAGTQAQEPLAHFVNDIAPYLCVFILGAEAAALVVLCVGVARWPLQIIRSPRWLLSAFGIVFVGFAILLFVYGALVTAISLP